MASIPDDAFQEAVSGLLKHIHTVPSELAVQQSSQSYPMAQLEREGCQLEQVVAQFNIKATHAISQLRRRRNRLTFIYKLPAELLVTVLSLAADTDPPSRYISLRNLASVSSHWLTVILSTPSFWNRLESTSNFFITTHALRRSQKTPLHIMCPTDVVEEIERRFLDMVVPHISRWRTFQSFSSHTTSILSAIQIPGPAPYLEVFEVMPRLRTKTSIEVPQAILNSAPRLEKLVIPSFSFPIHSKALLGLKSITFCPYAERKHLTADQWYHFLSMAARSPNLKIIKIRGVSSRGRIEGHLPDIIMPNSKTIHLNQLSPAIIGSLLSSILVATKRCYFIRVISPLNFLDQFETMFPESVSSTSMLSAIRSGSHLEVSLNNDTVWVDWMGEKVAFSFYVSGMINTVVAGIFNSLISPHYLMDVTKMTLDGANLFTDRFLYSQFCHFTNLEWLKLCNMGCRTGDEATDPPLGEILKLLSSPVLSDEDGGDGERWLCPKLKGLEIKGANDFNATWQFIQGRYCDPAKDPNSILPVPLEELRLFTRTKISSLTSANRSIISQLEDDCGSQNIQFRCEQWGDPNQARI